MQYPILLIRRYEVDDENAGDAQFCLSQVVVVLQRAWKCDGPILKQVLRRALSLRCQRE